MKKVLLTAVLVSGLGLFTFQQASAQRGYGGGGDGWNDNCPQCDGQGYFSEVAEGDQEKLDKFFEDTKSLRKEMVQKRAEKRALMMAETPNAAAVGILAGEIFDLKTTIQAKAIEAGVRKYVGRGGRGGCGGPGQGMGNGMGKGHRPHGGPGHMMK